MVYARMTPMTEQDAAAQAAWERFGRLVKDARLRRGWRLQDELASAAGVSIPAVSKVERGLGGTGWRATTVALKIAAALGWPRGTVDRVLAGGDPPEDGQPDDSRPESLDDVITEIRASRELSRRDKDILVSLIEQMRQERPGEDR